MKILVIGGTGLVGSRFVELNREKFEIDAPSSKELDVLDIQNLTEYLKEHSSEVVLNLSGYTKVDDAENQKDDLNGNCYKLNVLAVHNLVKICGDLGKHLFHISTDYVFDGTKSDAPYTEEDKPNPVNWYSRTKFMGEEGVLSGKALYAIVRVEMPFSPNYPRKSDFARFFYNNLKEGKEIKALTDQKITPVFVDDCVKALEVLIENKFRGIIHVASSDHTTPFDFATKLAEEMGVSKDLIHQVTFEEFSRGRKALRPQHSWMSVKKFESIFGENILKTNEEEIKEFIRQIT